MVERKPWPELLVLLLAALTRFWRLDYHSFWFDEAVSLTWSRTAPEYTWDVTLQLVKDKHPPVYYLLLHYWRELLKVGGLGDNDAALRALGALLGVLTVAGMLLLATRLSGRATGLLAGGLVALSPVLVWYSQEARMFQPATTALVWAAYCLLRAWHSPRWLPRLGWWAALCVALLAALYSYLFSAFVLPAAGLTLAALWVDGALRARRQRQAGLPAAPPANPLRLFGEGCLALALTTALFLPLARNAWLANSADGSPGQAFMNLGATLQHQLQVFTVWRADWGAVVVNGVLLLWGVLVLVGLLLPWRSARGRKTARVSFDQVWLWLWIGAPLLVGNLLLARNDTIFAEDRYFLFLGPFVLWAAGRGVVALGARRRAAAWLLGVVAVVTLAAALPRLWTPAMAREDWRAATTYIADYQAASPGLPAATVAHVDYTRAAVSLYLRQRYTREQLPIYYPFGGTLTPDQVDTVIAPPLLGVEEAGAATLWLTQSHLEGVDDGRLVEGWLGQHYPLVTEQYPTGVKLTGYAVQHQFDALPPLAPDAVRPAAELAPGLTLAACEIVTPAVSATDERMHPPSGWVHVRLWWQATGPITDDYIATVQMVGPEGVWGDRLYRDNETLRRYPTSTWTSPVYLRDEIDVNLNPLTPAGEYPISVGLRNAAGEETGNKAECGRVKIGA